MVNWAPQLRSERPEPSRECEGGWTQGSMLISWLEAREIQSRSHSEAAGLPPSVEENWWESLNPAQTSLGKREGREWSAGWGGVTTITALFPDCRHALIEGKQQPRRAVLSECRLASGPPRKKEPPLLASFLNELFECGSHGLPPPISVCPSESPSPQSSFLHSHVCSHSPTVCCQILSPAP